MNKDILISDPTLRDGSHAIKHKLALKQIESYCLLAEEAGIPIVEVGHGNGLGASSLQLGLSSHKDTEMLTAARKTLKKSMLGIHIIPGFATIKKDLEPAIDLGIDVVRVACHCTEADLTESHISFARKKGMIVWGCLMMSHMLSEKLLVEQAIKMKEYGVEGVVIMDSSGTYLPEDVFNRISTLVDGVNIDIGFHAHNNLGMGIANSVSAIDAGATLIDGSSRGFGAGAGNAQLEVLIAVLRKMKINTGIDLYKVLDLGDLAEDILIEELPRIKATSVISGLAGVFSGFAKPVNRIAIDVGVDPRDIFMELGKRKIIAGQEDIILEVALGIKDNESN